MIRKEDLRIVFMGTPEFAVGTLQALVEGGYNVVAVVTQPDKPVGRHGTTLSPSEVKKYALQQNIPVLQPEKMKDPEFVEQLRGFAADLQVVVAFRMLPEVVWAMPRYGTFNVHAALLPQYRGAAPINWAVINGETTTGVSTFFLDHDIDTGKVIMKRPFDIPDDADVEYVYDGLMKLGAQAAIDTIDLILAGDGQVEAVDQEEMVEGVELKPAPKIFNDTCRINWRQPTKRIYDFVRGLSPYPGAWTTLVDAEGSEPVVVKIFKTAKCQPDSLPTTEPGSIMMEKGKLYVVTGDGAICVETVQKAGKKRMDAAAFINGMRNLETFVFE